MKNENQTKIDPNKKTKQNIYISIVVVAVVVICLIIYLITLWRGNKTTARSEVVTSNNQISSTKISSTNISKYTKASEETVERETIAIYIDEILNLFERKDYNGIFKKLNEDFIEKNNLSEYNFENYLNDNHYIAEQTSANYRDINFYSSSSDVYIYRVKFSFDRYELYVYFIETSPYEYTISLEQETIPYMEKTEMSATVDDIEFNISVREVKDNSIKYYLKVKNNGEKIVKFDFSSVNTIELQMRDGGCIKQPSTILDTANDYSLNQDSYFTMKLYFPINMQYLKDIIGINFYDVKIGNVEKNIYVRF